eukprot:6191709-Pleurochrysis_carterae.AAC.2
MPCACLAICRECSHAGKASEQRGGEGGGLANVSAEGYADPGDGATASANGAAGAAATLRR